MTKSRFGQAAALAAALVVLLAIALPLQGAVAVASRLNTFTDQGQGFAADASHMSRVRHQCAKPCTSIQVVFTNYQTASFSDVDTGNAITIKAALDSRLPAPGTSCTRGRTLPNREAVTPPDWSR
jgi:hypothetical protein